MNPIDDMFRKGLADRPGEVPADMWSRVQAGQTMPAPEGTGLDKLFSDGLKDHAGQVPADMWSRIAATGLPEAAAVDQVFADGLKDREADVPAGLWDKIWRARAAAPRFNAGHWASAAAAVLLLLLAGWWLLPGADNTSPTDIRAEKTAGGFSVEKISPENKVDGELKGASANSRSSRELLPEDGGGASANSRSSRELLPEDGGVASVNSRSSRELLPEDGGVASVNSRSSRELLPEDGGVASVNSRSSRELLPEDGGVASVNSRSSRELLPEDGGVASANSRSSRELLPEDGAPFVENPYLLNEEEAITTLPESNTLNVVTSNQPTQKDIKVKGRYRPKPSNDRAFRAATRHRFQTELLFGAAYADQQLTPATDAARTLSSLREVSEFPELSYQVSLRGVYNLSERLIFLGGLTYAEIRNQFEFERTVAGETSLVRTNNSLRMLEAPLLLGYRVPGRRLQVSVNAGPVVNLSTSARGRFLSPDSPQPRDLAIEGNYRNNVGVGFMTSISTTYQIGKKEPFVLLVEPFFKAYPTAFTTRDAPVKETYWLAGFQLGVRKGF